MGDLGLPLVGRDHEVAALSEALSALRDGRGNCVILSGPAGIGKTRLIDLVGAEAARASIVVAFGRATEIDRGVPLRPLHAALATIDPTLRGADSAGTQLQKIERIGAAIESFARERPLVIAIDDCQWIDEESALALRMLVPQLASAPVLWLLARRPVPLDSPAQDAIGWLVRDGATELVLGELDGEAVARLASHLLGAAADVSVLQLAEQARGNPFLVTLTLHTMRAAGQILIVDHTASVVGDELPTDLLSATRQIVRGLTAETQQLLEAGAVLGRPFSVYEAESVRHVSPNTYLPATAEALAAEVLRADGTQLEFTHDLLRQAVYQWIPGPIRAALHRQAAQVIESGGGSPAEVANHYLRSGPAGARAAVRFLREAAAELAPHAPATAADLLQQAIARLDQADPALAVLSAEAVRLVAVSGQVERARELAEAALVAKLDRATEAEVLLGLAEALKHAGHNALSVQYTQRALTRDGVPWPIQAQLHAVAAHALLWSEDIRLADEAGARAERLGTAANEFSSVVFGATARSVVARAEGRLADALDHATRATQLADEHGGHARQRHPRIWLGSALAASDRLDEAGEVLRLGRREADRLGTAWSQPLWHFYLAGVIAAGGDLESARAEAEAGLLWAEQLTAVQLSIPLHGLLARIAVLQDQLPQARHHVRQLRELLANGLTAALEDLSWAAAMTADAQGQPDEALAALDGVFAQLPGRLLSLSDEPGRGPVLVRLALAAGNRSRARAAVEASQVLAERNGAVASVRGAAAHAHGLLDGDLDALRHAVTLLEASPRVLDRAQAQEDCALLEFANDRPRAIELMESAVELYRECGAQRPGKRAAKTLRTWGVRRPVVSTARSSAVFGLTPTELQVARAAAEGLTNREIGERMFISRYTVDTHLRAIFRKTGVKGRSALGRLLHPIDDEDQHRDDVRKRDGDPKRDEGRGGKTDNGQGP